jgi:hypothetical protein
MQFFAGAVTGAATLVVFVLALWLMGTCVTQAQQSCVAYGTPVPSYLVGSGPMQTSHCIEYSK